jgi:hypothetical protein
MTPRTTYSAPWGRSVRWATPLTILIVAGMEILLVVVGRGSMRISPGGFWATVAILPILVAGTSLFAVRGYRLVDGTLEVLRPGWISRVCLDGLQSVRTDPEAFRGVWAKAGSDGFLGLFGWFWSRRLGLFRAWATDPLRCVRMTFPNRVVVVSPDDPAAFVASVEHQKGWPRDFGPAPRSHAR